MVKKKCTFARQEKYKSNSNTIGAMAKMVNGYIFTCKSLLCYLFIPMSHNYLIINIDLTMSTQTLSFSPSFKAIRKTL